MRMMNRYTGDILELPPPNKLGESVIVLNGKVVEHVLYSDVNGGSITLGDGTMFEPGSDAFIAHVTKLPEPWVVAARPRRRTAASSWRVWWVRQVA